MSTMPIDQANRAGGPNGKRPWGGSFIDRAIAHIGTIEAKALGIEGSESGIDAERRQRNQAGDRLADRLSGPSRSGESCFVATAVYGDPCHPDVAFLRWYRDNRIAASGSGRAFIRAYWVVGPYLAKAIRPLPGVRAVVQLLLARLVLVLRRDAR